MKPVCWIVASLVIGWAVTGTAQAGEPQAAGGSVPPAMLADLGLSGFQPMSEAQALSVRGKAVSVSTWGSVRIGGTTYPGTTFAGSNSSFTFTFKVVGPVFAGGASFASAH